MTVVGGPRVPVKEGGKPMVVLRRTIGSVLRDQRRRQGRTLREVSSSARVSLGYLSEVERGQKEASSELLASICSALELPLSHVLHEVTQRVADAEGTALDGAPTTGPAPEPVLPAAAARAVASGEVPREVLPEALLAAGPAGAAERDEELVSGLVQDLAADVLVPDVLPADLVDALVDVLPELAPGDLQRALASRQRRRLATVA